MIIRTKKDIAAYVAASPEVLESKTAYEEDETGDFEEVANELVKVIMCADGGPDFGDEWEPWLTDNIGDMLEEAISIVM